MLIYHANRRPDKQATLQTAREHLEVIRLLIRLMHGLHQIGLLITTKYKDKKTKRRSRHEDLRQTGSLDRQQPLYTAAEGPALAFGTLACLKLRR
jgi:hypothetical protein